MDNSSSRSQVVFCTALTFILLLGNTFVHGRTVNKVNKRYVPDYTNSNYGYPDYPSRNPNNQPSTGSHLYPTLDFDSLLRPYVNPNPIRIPVAKPFPTNNFSNYNVGPKFQPFPNNRHNVTYHPNFNFSNGIVHPIHPPNKNHNFSSGWNGIHHNQHNGQNIKPFPNSNFTGHHNNGRPINVQPINVRPVPKTTCGKTLCSYVPSYPTKEISQAVDRARDALKSGVPNASLRNKGLSIYNFNSKIHSADLGNNAAAAFGMTPCRTKAETIYPHEGFSSDDSNAYYVVNIPTLSQSLPTAECDGNDGQSCGQRAVSMSEVRTCQQTYRKVPLLALPSGRRNFDIDDFQLRMFDVPAGCNCMRRGY